MFPRMAVLFGSCNFFNIVGFIMEVVFMAQLKMNFKCLLMNASRLENPVAYRVTGIR